MKMQAFVLLSLYPQQRISNAKENPLGQEILVVLSSKAGANKGEQADGRAGEHERAGAVFVKDGADDGAAEEEDEELGGDEQLAGVDWDELCILRVV